MARRPARFVEHHGGGALCAPALSRILRGKGVMAVERLMGMLLVMNGIERYPQHGGAR